MLFSDLQKITEGTTSISNDLEVSRFSTDSRTLSGTDQEVFIAIQGKRDGHDYIQSALDKGVKNFIVENPQEKGFNSFVVNDSLQALQEIAKTHRNHFNIPIIGITGSNGKTTVKEWLSTLIGEKFYVIKNPKSYNSQIGVPLSILEMRKGHEIGVFEAGISTTNEMSKLASIIQPSIGIFTTLGNAHQEGFDSMDQKLQEKLQLFGSANKIICRSDALYYPKIEKAIGDKIKTWALDTSGMRKVVWSAGSIKIDEHVFRTELNDHADLENITHAIVAALECDLSTQEIQAGLDIIKPVPMRLEFKKGINGCYLLDDSYNNDLAGLKVALEYLSTHQQNEKRTLILSDMLQSGEPDEELYAHISSLLLEKGITRLIGVGNRISSIQEKLDLHSTFYPSTKELLNKLPDFEDEMILIKGARDFAFERIVRVLEEKTHGTVLEVSFEALQHNLNQYRSLLKETTKLMVMVKANAYGSGLLEVAHFLQHQGVDQLGVAYVDEAIQLRKNGITLPIMIMNPHIESFSEFEKYDLQAEVFSISHLRRMLSDTENPPAIHIKIDTGMHRLGFAIDQIPDLLREIAANPKIKVAGIFTHFSSSDDPNHDDYTISQAKLFDQVYQMITDTLGYTPIRHACNSPAMVRWPQYHFEMVRLGIGLHGFDPSGTLHLRTTSQLKTVISQIQHLKKGDTVGYSRKGVLKKASKIAVLPIGYEDGYLRSFGNGKGRVLVNGLLCPTIGNICMDMTMVDVTNSDVKEGDEVIIFGQNPSISELAEWSDTIPYEILTNVSSRVKRIFVSD